MNIYTQRREGRTLSLNKGTPKHERVSTEPETNVLTFIVYGLVEKFFLGLEIDKPIGPENLKLEE